MFDNFDREEKVDVIFQNSKFVIKFKNNKKIFNAYYIRFIIIITSLSR